MSGLSELPAYRRLALEVVGAEGHDLVLANGRRVLDLYGGHCVNSLGAGDAELGRVLARQWHELSFTTNLLVNPARDEFLEAFGAALPPVDDGWRVFVSNSGAEANENALKCALLHTRRTRIVVFDGAFHGRTAAAAHASDGTSSFPGAPFDVVRVAWNDLAAARNAIDERTAGVLIEPIQSLAGVRTPPAEFLRGLRDAAEAAGALLLFDEVQTGNGRLGRPWAADFFGVVPDVFSTAKGVAGGFPMGLTVMRERALEGVDPAAFGSTFGGGPLALRAAAHVAARVHSPVVQAHVRKVSNSLGELATLAPFEGLRGAGLLLGFTTRAGCSAASVRDALLARDVLVGTSNDPAVVRISPPLTLGLEEVRRFRNALEDSFSEFTV